MKAMIFEIKRFAVHDGDGIRTTVFFSGCPLKCRWCHNPEGLHKKSALAFYKHKCVGCGECIAVCPTMSQKNANGMRFYEPSACIKCGKCAENCLGNALTLYGREVTVEELLPELLKDIEFYKTSNGGVTLSGGECLTEADFCRELLIKLKEQGINTAIDTCGFVSKTALNKVIPYTDIFLYDIKASDSEVHKKCTGQGNEIILDNLRYLDENGCKIEVRIPFVPGYNDDQMEGIAEILKGVKNLTKVRVLPYHNYAGSKYDALGLENSLPPVMPTDEQVEKARETIKNILNREIPVI